MNDLKRLQDENRQLQRENKRLVQALAAIRDMAEKDSRNHMAGIHTSRILDKAREALEES